ncbi:MAG: SUMF1/EgtB/PvdO family nonheme iron enzyme [Bacteroidota bacterium]|nr:SUMF1/EgtB/PvdO family nonheme iron enzyme [Bacteroidota bacterium]
MKKIIFTLSFIFLTILGFSQKPDMILIEGGSFYLGNDYSLKAFNEKPEHKVTISDFYMSKYEVTFEMFDNFCNTTGFPKTNDGGYGRDKKPVINISWIGAVKYCNWLSIQNGYDRVYELSIDTSGTTIKGIDWNASGYRLPTEAEWEYVAKGGNDSKGYAYPGSNNPDEIAWYFTNSNSSPHDVGTKKPNELGIYDISGNAYEWCNDIYNAEYYSEMVENNPKGPDSGNHKVYRGGNFNSTLDFLRISKRYSLAQNLTTGLIGIRLVQQNIGQ